MLNIVLYEPEIPQNTGNIMRTCMAFGMKLHLIEPLGFYMDEKHLRRAGMDYRNEIEYQIWPDWKSFVQACPGSFYYVTRYGSRSPDTFDFAKDPAEEIYLVFGKESTGIPKDILAAHMERCMRIPMVPEARSLNLSNSVAIIAYEVLRQLGYPHLSRTEAIKGADFLASQAQQ